MPKSLKTGKGFMPACLGFGLGNLLPLNLFIGINKQKMNSKKECKNMNDVDARWEVYEVVHGARINLEQLMYGDKKIENDVIFDVFKNLVDMENNILNNKPVREK